ncbi:hypothetical protein VP1G_11245 [Cytospora mali]|uniref:Uncharacterized protein n=1 Tax=Cytospora mali TaxID=578113 RepID=A0A194VAR0_CYTMA|nr:hypothetical protein VP1G_11245 [Valsa mali var. pyri (nom. inval.)]
MSWVRRNESQRATHDNTNTTTPRHHNTLATKITEPSFQGLWGKWPGRNWQTGSPSAAQDVRTFGQGWQGTGRLGH